MKALYAKLLALQKEIKPILKDSENPYFKSKYFDINSLLAELKPIFSKHNLLVLQPLVTVDGKGAVETMVVDTESGDTHKSLIVLPENLKAQEMGSAVTYLRRYSLQSLLLLEAEDDDGNVASNKVVGGTATRTAPPKTYTKQNPANDLPFIG